MSAHCADFAADMREAFAAVRKECARNLSEGRRSARDLKECEIVEILSAKFEQLYGAWVAQRESGSPAVDESESEQSEHDGRGAQGEGWASALDALHRSFHPEPADAHMSVPAPAAASTEAPAGLAMQTHAGGGGTAGDHTGDGGVDSDSLVAFGHSRLQGTEPAYLVKWRGLSCRHATWERASVLLRGCPAGARANARGGQPLGAAAQTAAENQTAADNAMLAALATAVFRRSCRPPDKLTLLRLQGTDFFRLGRRPAAPLLHPLCARAPDGSRSWVQASLRAQVRAQLVAYWHVLRMLRGETDEPDAMAIADGAAASDENDRSDRMDYDTDDDEEEEEQQEVNPSPLRGVLPAALLPLLRQCGAPSTAFLWQRAEDTAAAHVRAGGGAGAGAAGQTREGKASTWWGAWEEQQVAAAAATADAGGAEAGAEEAEAEAEQRQEVLHEVRIALADVVEHVARSSEPVFDEPPEVEYSVSVHPRVNGPAAVGGGADAGSGLLMHISRTPSGDLKVGL
jgi:hypothetical protein